MELESSTPLPIRLHCMYAPISSRLTTNKLLPVSTSGFQNRKSYFGGKTDVQSHRYDARTAVSRAKLQMGWAPEVEIWRKPEKWNRRRWFPIRPPIHYGVYLDSFWHSRSITREPLNVGRWVWSIIPQKQCFKYTSFSLLWSEAGENEQRGDVLLKRTFWKVQKFSPEVLRLVTTKMLSAHA